MEEYKTQDLLSVVEKHAQSKGYEIDPDVVDHLSSLINSGESNFVSDSRDFQTKLDDAKSNMDVMMEKIIARENDPREIHMHEWMKDLKGWICPLFPIC